MWFRQAVGVLCGVSVTDEFIVVDSLRGWKNLKELCLSADILIVALGRAEFITVDMVKDGACVIDVGISRVKSDKTKSGWKLKGDVNYDEVAPKCDFITPVPGGVGPMTIAMLLKNTLYAVKGFN